MTSEDVFETPRVMPVCTRRFEPENGPDTLYAFDCVHALVICALLYPGKSPSSVSSISEGVNVMFALYAEVGCVAEVTSGTPGTPAVLKPSRVIVLELIALL